MNQISRSGAPGADNAPAVNDRHQLIFSSVIFIIVGLLAFFVFLPFFNVLALSVILAILLNPVFRLIKLFVKKDAIAAMLSVLLLALVIVVPLVLVTNTIVDQAQSLYNSVSSSESLTSDGVTGWVEGKAQRILPSSRCIRNRI